LVRINGKPGLTLSVQKLAKANTIDVVDRIVKAIPKLQGVPETIQLSISFDQSVYIRQTIAGLQREALLGALLAMAVILFFLRNVRGTMIIIVAIPLSIFFTFIFFRFSSLTLNIMTFGGLALVIGRLVDDSIVELEVISRHYNERDPDKSRLQKTLEAAKEVASPIFVSTLSTVIVFLPIVFLTGIAKLLFVPLTLTIAIALFGSFLVSRTVTPLLCLKYLPPETKLDRESKRIWSRLQVLSHDFIESLDGWYSKRLRWALSHRRFVVISIVGLGLVSAGLFQFIGTEFFPDQDEGQFNVNIKLPVGTGVEETDKATRQVEEILRKEVPEAETMTSEVGVPSARGGGFGGRNSGSHAANIRVALKPIHDRDRDVFQIIKEVRPKVNRIPGALVTINQSGLLKFLMNFGSSAPIVVEIIGYDLETGSKLAQVIAGIVRETLGATDVQVSREENLPELRVRIDREKAGILGISAGQIANTINTCINGTVASLYSDPVTGNQYNILVRLNESYRSQLDDLGNVALNTPDGKTVLLRNVAVIERTNSPVQIDRKNQQRLVEVTANVSGRDLGSVANDIRARLDTLQVPAGFEVKLGGNVEQQQQTFKDLLLAFALAILLVYVVMSSQFQSLLDPFVIMFTVPLGIVGVLWTLFLTNTTLSVTSFQGIIVMVGIVVSNGILLVDYTNRLRRSGVELYAAVEKASVTRLKPILMTSIVTVFGLMPMALSIGGESTQAPLALAVIGGLTVSTVLTLFFVPVLYTIFEQHLKKPAAEQLESIE
ncbi:MAG: efflux RND transporter permease subunit, partial [bacterium]|nr:efflux RND transporter permease subunit [bacterium]